MQSADQSQQHDRRRLGLGLSLAVTLGSQGRIQAHLRVSGSCSDFWRACGALAQAPPSASQPIPISQVHTARPRVRVSWPKASQPSTQVPTTSELLDLARKKKIPQVPHPRFRVRVSKPKASTPAQRPANRKPTSRDLPSKRSTLDCARPKSQINLDQRQPQWIAATRPLYQVQPPDPDSSSASD